VVDGYVVIRYGGSRGLTGVRALRIPRCWCPSNKPRHIQRRARCCSRSPGHQAWGVKPKGSGGYRVERRRLEALLAELPLAADSNLLAFDRAASTLLPFASIIEGTTAAHQRAIVTHTVERVTIGDRAVTDVDMRPEARPFFADYHAGVVPVAVWRWRPRTDSGTHQQRSVLDWYLEVG
jgi:hypothetical protein